MLVHFKGVLGKASVLLVVAITATLKVTRVQEIVDNGVDAGTSGRAEDLTDPVFSIGHVRHGFGNLYSSDFEFLHRNHATRRLDIQCATPSRGDLSKASWPGRDSLYLR